MSTNSIYVPLNPRGRKIRLLELQPGQWDDTISVNLIESTIGDGTDYITISYTWGSVDVARQVLVRCNGVNYSISENLFTILRRLRWSHGKAILVWADALCINQTDTTERTHQVGLMGEIYRNSSETVIWLGEQSPQDDVGSRFLDRNTSSHAIMTSSPIQIAWKGNSRDQELLQAYLLDQEEESWQNDVFGAFCLISSIAEGTSDSMFKLFDSRPTDTRHPFLYLMDMQNSKASRILSGLQRLISSPWWRRIWVVQETVLARKATVQYGILSAPWTMLAKAATRWAQDQHSLCLDLSGTFQGHGVLNKFSTAVLQFNETRNDHQSSAQDSTLLSLLWKFRPLEATDKRDKVYALLGMTTNWQGRPPMTPDYSISASAVFLRTTINNIHRAQSLTVLAGDLEAILNRKSIAEMPSWVMDWSLPCLSQEVSRVASLNLYNADGGLTGPVRTHRKDPILEIEGVYLDPVVVVGNVSRHTQVSDTHAVLREWRLLSRAQEQKRGRYPVTWDTYEDAFWRTLIGDQVYDNSNIDSHHLPAPYDENSFHVDTSMDENRTGQPNRRRATPDDENSFRAWHMWSRCITRDTIDRRAFLSERDLSEGISSIHYALKTTTASRRFFITQSGFMGIGPRTTRIGDEVYVVKNSRVPFLLRRRFERRRAFREKDWYSLIRGHSSGPAIKPDKASKEKKLCHRLVGDCFVYGVMDGVVLEDPDVKVEKLYLV
ncbi:unnamed protein product [Periconia digitata]|uniref:Heterokaryon incompatibility domain-containing protein n=1 Tax=Periconia digitata TaxID=1303443 RepID=A0A9W4UID2_9PLEO|nr:unnamed protein product [Periconia digitata]